jgi:NADPH-dependent F420 reductase
MSVIAIVGGTGPEGTGLASRWARAGESIILGSRQAERARAAAERLSQNIGAGAAIEGDENSAAVARADVVVLTIPFSAHAETLKNLKSAFRSGTVLIDTTVPLASSVGGRATQLLGVWQGSAAQQAAELVPKGVEVAAAFQNISAELLPGNAPVECDAIICADDPRAREIANQLARKIPGVRALDGGKLENARIVEQLTALLITLNTRHKAHGTGLRITGLDERRS